MAEVVGGRERERGDEHVVVFRATRIFGGPKISAKKG